MFEVNWCGIMGSMGGVGNIEDSEYVFLLRRENSDLLGVLLGKE